MSNTEKPKTAVPEQDKPVMKTLANCTPVEFLRQTNKIRHAADGLLEDSGVKEIRKRLPELTGEETAEEKERLLDEQVKKNLDAILDSLMDTNAEDTIKVLGMMCFLEPEEIEKTTTAEFFAPAMELLSSKPVMNFLSLLLKSALKDTGA